MAKAVMVLESDGAVFEWHGGPYIDIVVDGSAVDVINVWDYAKDQPFIPVTLEAFEEVIDKYLAEQV